MGAWVDLCGLAKWKDGGGLKRGQIRASVRFLAERWNWTFARTQRFLVELEEGDDPSIKRESKAGRKPQVITICKYNTYQSAVEKSGSQASRKTKMNHERVHKTDHKRITKDKGRQGVMPDNESKAGRKLNHERDQRSRSTKDLPVLSSEITPPQKEPADTERGEVAEEHPNGMPSLHQQLMDWWLSRLPIRPDNRTVSRNAAAAKRLVENCSREQLRMAVQGIERLYPHSAGEPWDLFDLERKMAKAIGAAEESQRWRDAQEIESEVARMKEKFPDG